MRRFNTHAVPIGKANPNRRCLSQTRATKPQRERARLRTDQATSKWRTTMRDHRIVHDSLNDSWSIIHFSGEVIGTYADITAATAALS